MRIAICYFGQVRELQRSIIDLVENSIEKDDIIDVYIHCWFDNNKYIGVNSGQNIYNELEISHNIEDIKKFFKPLKFVSENQINFDINCFNITGPYIKPTKNTISRFYSTETSYKLIEDPKKYDWIISTRFDAKFRSYITRIDFKKMEKEFVYSAYLHKGTLHFKNENKEIYNSLPSSIFEVCSPVTSDIFFGKIFSNINNYGLGENGGGGEQILWCAATKNDLKIKEIPIFTKFDNESIVLYHSMYIINRDDNFNGLFPPYNSK
jgi:hypothetical protein